MSEKVAIKKTTLEGIGNAIRGKDGSTELIPVNALADRIMAIQTVGGENKLPQLVDGTLTEITAEDLEGATKINQDTFRRCFDLKRVTLPDTITSIGNSAFLNCYQLTSIIIPNSVTSIEHYAFQYCGGLRSITIGNSVTSIAYGAFQSVGSTIDKATFTFLGTIPPTITTETFSYASTNKIIVPVGCGEAYKTATNWADLADFIEEATV